MKMSVVGFLFSMLGPVLSNAQVVYGPEPLTLSSAQTATITKTIDLTGKPKGSYVLKGYNGERRPEKLDYCKTLTPAGNMNQCLYDNMRYWVSDQPTLMTAVTVKSVNGVTVNSNVTPSLWAFGKSWISLNQDINIIEFTVTGYPTSLYNFTLEPIAQADIKPFAIIGVNNITSSTAAAFTFKSYSRNSVGTNLTHTWNFGDGSATTTGTSVNHTFTTAGNYNVSLVVQNTAGQQDSQIIPVVVTQANPVNPPANQAPYIYYQISYPDASDYRKVRVDVNGSYDPDGYISTYTYIWGDGTQTTGSYGEHTFATEGTYVVLIRATDNQNLKNEKEVSVNATQKWAYDRVETTWGPSNFSGTTAGTSSTTNFTIPQAGTQDLYRIRVKNADGQERITNQDCTGWTAIYCSYMNSQNQSYIDQYRATNVELSINNRRLIASGALNQTKYLFEGITKLNASNSLYVKVWGASTSFVNVEIEKITQADDTSAPVITILNAPTTGFTNDPSFRLGVQIADQSPTVTYVKRNGTNAVWNSAQKNFSVALSEGQNLISVSSTDNLGKNTTLDLPPIVSDTVSPTLTLPIQKNLYYKDPSGNAFIVIGFSEALSSIIINGVTFHPSLEARSIEIQAPYSGNGDVPIVAQATDLAGNQSATYSDNFHVLVDAVKPVLASTYNSVRPTKLGTVNVPLTVSDSSPVWTSITVNGVEQFQTGATSFLAPIILSQEGINTVVFKSTDAAGNESDPLTLSIVRDQTNPQFLAVSPNDNESLDRVVFPVSVTSDEKLSEAYVNGMHLTISSDGLTASGSYFSQQGVQSLEFEITDLAGNVSSITRSTTIEQKLLIPELVSIVPDSNLDYLWVKGQASSTKPGSAVYVSEGFFSMNYGATVSNSTGAFAIRLSKFTNANLKVTDSVSGRIETMDLNYLKTTVISGIVKDSGGNPLPGATVFIKSRNMSVETDATGTFSFISDAFGVQTLVVDGSTIPQTVTGADRAFSKTSIVLNIGLGQTNVLQRPIFLAPLVKDGTQTVISVGSNAVVQSPNAPGVKIQVPAGKVKFPTGSSSGEINVATISASNATIPVPEAAVPNTVVALEPSGTQFTERVPLTLPNDNDFPAGTEMIILSMNSSKGIWEVDGHAKVGSSGSTIETLPDEGISHFSLVYAVPSKPLIVQVSDPKFIGIDASQGSLTSSIELPTFKAGGATVAPKLLYKSGWANPTAFVTNLFDLPKSETKFDYTTNTEGAPQIKHYKVCAQLFGWEITSTCDMQDYLIRTQYQTHDVGSVSYIPDSIKSQLFVSSLASNQLIIQDSNSNVNSGKIPGPHFRNSVDSQITEVNGLPSKALMSYAVPLRDSTTNEFLPSGLYPSLARYEIKYRNLVMRTVTTTVTGSVDRLDASGHEDLKPQIISNNYNETQILDGLMPKDLISTIAVVNKVNSEVGRGWSIGGIKKILNPQNEQIVLDNGDGSLSSYGLNNSVSVLVDKNSSNIKFDQAMDLSSYPNAYVITEQAIHKGSIAKVNLLTKASSVIAPLYQTKQNYFFYPEPQWDAPPKCLNGNTSNRDWYHSQGYYKPFASSLIGLPNGAVMYAGVEGSLLQAFAGNTIGLSSQLKSSHITVPNPVPAGYYLASSPMLGNSAQDAVDKFNNTDYSGAFYYLTDPVFRGNFPCNAYPPEYVTSSNEYFQDWDYTGIVDGVAVWPDEAYLFQDDSNSYRANVGKPFSLRMGPDGNIYMSMTDQNSIRVLDANTHRMKLFAGNFMNVDVGDGLPAREAGIVSPTGLDFDTSGNIFFATGAGHIRKIDTSGIISTLGGLPLEAGGTLSSETHVSNMAFSNLKGLVIDKSKNLLYVADSGNNRVVKVNLDNQLATVVAGTGVCDVQNLDLSGTATAISLCSPSQLGLDPSGNLLINDSGHERVVKVAFNALAGGTLSFLPTSKDGSTLSRLGSGGFTLTLRNGTKAFFDADGKQRQIVDRLNNATIFNYDGENISSITDSSGGVTSFTYSGGRVASITDPAIRTTSFTYSSGNLTSVNFPDGSSKSFAYDSNGQMIKEINQVGAQTKFSYNQFNRLEKVTDSMNSETIVNDSISGSMVNNYTAGAVGNLASAGLGAGQVFDSVVDSRNAETTFAKDFMGFISRVKDAEGYITTYERNVRGQTTAIIYPDGSKFTFVYDPITFDLLSTKDETLGIVESQTFDYYGNITSKTDGNGHAVVKNYSQTTGRLMSETDSKSSTVSYLYTSKGFPLSKTVSAGATESLTTQYVTDLKGNVGTVILPDGKQIRYAYDLAGNVVATEKDINSSKLEKTQYFYDSFNRLVKVISPNNEITTYTYSLAGELTEVKDAKGNLTNFEYDQRGQLKKKINPLGKIWTYNYDGNGNLISEIDANANLHSYTYDGLNQLTLAQFPDNSISYQYDFKGAITKVKDSVSQIDVAYDTKGRATYLQTSGLGIMSSYPIVGLNQAYDNAGNRVGTTSQLGSTIYNYDGANQLVSLQHPLGTFSFAYDKAHRLLQVARPGSQSNFSYTNSSAISSIIHSSNNVTKSFVQYDFDLRNFPTARHQPFSDVNYGYDSNGQLMSANLESFSYDSLGNRTSDANGQMSYDSASQRLVEDWQFNYVYDNNGNLIQKIPKVSNKPAFQYTYSSRNQLLQVKILESTLAQVNVQIDYVYDAIGRRMQKSVWDRNSQADIKKTYVRKFIYDNQSVVGEYDSGNTLLVSYVHNPSVADDVLAMNVTSAGVTAGIGSSSGVGYFLKDSLGSITDIINANGDIIQRYRYSAFGSLNAILDSAGADITHNPLVNNKYLYTGREFEDESGLYYYRARYYDSSIGRFLQEDSHPGLVGNPVSVVNKFAYGGNSPTVNVDPNGKFFFALVGAIVWGAIMGAITGAVIGGIVASANNGNFWDGAHAGFWGGMKGGAIFGGLGFLGGALAATAGWSVATGQILGGLLAGTWGAYEGREYGIGGVLIGFTSGFVAGLLSGEAGYHGVKAAPSPAQLKPQPTDLVAPVVPVAPDFGLPKQEPIPLYGS